MLDVREVRPDLMYPEEKKWPRGWDDSNESTVSAESEGSVSAVEKTISWRALLEACESVSRLAFP
jgi:hypothetical protein